MSLQSQIDLLSVKHSQDKQQLVLHSYRIMEEKIIERKVLHIFQPSAARENFALKLRLVKS